MPCGAPGNFISITDCPGIFFKVTPRPPIKFAEPGKICKDVIPPARAVTKPGSCGQTLCSAHTSAVLGAVASFPSEWALTLGAGYTPRCECTSITPGVIHIPFASITIISSATKFGPIASIFPSLRIISVFSKRSPLPVSTVAPLNSVGDEDIG